MSHRRPNTTKTPAGGSGPNSRSSSGASRSRSSTSGRNAAAASPPGLVEVKSKFDAEFRRFSVDVGGKMADFLALVQQLHKLDNIPFTLCYTDHTGELLPITNAENFHKSLGSARPTLRLLVRRKGESWEEKYGFGTDTMDRKRRGLSALLANAAGQKLQPRNYNISQPEDFRQVSAIIDVHVVPVTHRRVKLCKHGSDKPLGFYIRDGTSVRVTASGVVKVPGIFISRLVPGGLAESTGLLAVNDEVLEVNGIEVLGKTLDQVTDMMVANASNLIITVKPANQRLTLQRPQRQVKSSSPQFSANEREEEEEEEGEESEEDDEIKDVLLQEQHKQHWPANKRANR